MDGLVSPQRLKKRPMLMQTDPGEVYRREGEPRSISLSPRSDPSRSVKEREDESMMDDRHQPDMVAYKSIYGGLSMEAPLQSEEAWNHWTGAILNCESAEDESCEVASPFRFYDEADKKKSSPSMAQRNRPPPQQGVQPGTAPVLGVNFMPPGRISNIQASAQGLASIREGYNNIRLTHGNPLTTQPIGAPSSSSRLTRLEEQVAAERLHHKTSNSSGTFGTSKSPHHATRLADQNAMTSQSVKKTSSSSPTNSTSNRQRTYTLEEDYQSTRTEGSAGETLYETPHGSPSQLAMGSGQTPKTGDSRRVSQSQQMSPASQAKKEFAEKQKRMNSAYTDLRSAAGMAQRGSTTAAGTSSSASSATGSIDFKQARFVERHKVPPYHLEDPNRRTQDPARMPQAKCYDLKAQSGGLNVASNSKLIAERDSYINNNGEMVNGLDNYTKQVRKNYTSDAQQARQEARHKSFENPCQLSSQYAREIAERPDELPMEPIVEYYMENLEVIPKPVGPDKNGRMVQHPPYKIKILSVEILPSSIYPPLSTSEIVQRDVISTNDIMNSPKHGNGRMLHSHLQSKMEEKLANSPNGGHRGSSFRGMIESEFGAAAGKRFFLKMKPARYAGHGKSSFHWQNGSSMSTWWRKKLCGKLREDGIYCPEIPTLGSNPLGRTTDNMLSSKDAFKKLSLTNPLGMPANKLNALAMQEQTGPDRPHMGIATLFKGMIVPNPLETYQQPGTFGNSRDPRAISEQANMTSPLHGIPRVKVPICCKRKICPDKDHHLRQMVVNLQSVLQLIYDFTGYGFDFMIDNTLAFCACSTTREKEEGVSYPMIMINLQRIPCKFAVLAHIVGHEYGHVMRGHLQQQCRCQHGPNSWQHKMLEYEADQFSALFIATMNIPPYDIYHHLANDEVRLSQLKHFVNTFSTHRERGSEKSSSPVKRLIKMLSKEGNGSSDER